MIPSEGQAEQIGVTATNGVRGRDFTVFTYPHKPSNLTAFGVRVNSTGVLLLHLP